MFLKTVSGLVLLALRFRPSNAQGGITACPTAETNTVYNDGVSMNVCSNTDYQGPSAQVVNNIASVAACRDLCHATTACIQAVFDHNGLVCHIKGDANQLTWAADNRFDTIRVVGRNPISKCPTVATNSTYADGQIFSICTSTDLQGQSINVVNGIVSDFACADLCDRTNGCTNAVYDKVNNICHVKGDPNGLTWVGNTQFTTVRLAGKQTGGSGYRIVGSSGVAVQMVFLPPNTTKAVFIDNYHINEGGPGYNLQTNTFGQSWTYPGTQTSVFGAEFDYKTYQLRTLRPRSNTFCSAGAFWPDGTMMNLAGAEPNNNDGVGDGFQAIRTYSPGPCANNVCTQDWVESKNLLQSRRWYPTAQTLTDGGVLVVGGSNAGGLVTNYAEINVPTYEKQYQNGQSTTPITLPILNFTAADDNNPRRSYNLYPSLHLLPNSGNVNYVFQMAATSAEVWNYDSNRQYKALPTTPNNQPRTFPATAMVAMLPLRLKDPVGEILVCGGASADAPNPATLGDCSRIRPLDGSAAWAADDALLNGPQAMSDGVLLPDGTILVVNGAHKGLGGGFMADKPVLTPMIYNPNAARGSRWTSLPGTNIPRLYHSVAHLLPTGEVLIAGSNPAVGFSADGRPPANKNFGNYDRTSFLLQQQDDNYPTEYRVELYSPPYLSAASRPIITTASASIRTGATFTATLNFNGLSKTGTIVAMLSNPGFSTHGVKMGQRMIELRVTNNNGQLTLTAPPNHSYVPPGFYLLFISVNGTPSEGRWIQVV